MKRKQLSKKTPGSGYSFTGQLSDLIENRFMGFAGIFFSLFGIAGVIGLFFFRNREIDIPDLSWFLFIAVGTWLIIRYRKEISAQYFLFSLDIILLLIFIGALFWGFVDSLGGRSKFGGVITSKTIRTDFAVSFISLLLFILSNRIKYMIYKKSNSKNPDKKEL